MKQKITITAIMVLTTIILFSPLQTKSQTFEKGNIFIDAFYGGPNLWPSTFKYLFVNYLVVDYTIYSFGPLGVRAEYLVKDKLGLGLDILYTESSIEWLEEDVVFGDTNIIYSNISISTWRITPRLNYHFSNNDHFDIYLVAGLGYKNTSYVIRMDDPFIPDEYVYNLFPISIRLGLGARYFVTDNFGLGLELGVGGAFATFGASYKF